MKRRIFIFFVFISLILSLFSCGFYSFTGIALPPDVKTFQVNYFQNFAGSTPGSTVEPGLERDFKIALEELIINQTTLNLVGTGGDLVFEGEITEFRIAPMSSTAENKASQNRLTMKVMLRFFNKKDDASNFEQSFSHYYDYPATYQLSQVKDEALEEIFDRITQNIVNKSMADW